MSFEIGQRRPRDMWGFLENQGYSFESGTKVFCFVLSKESPYLGKQPIYIYIYIYGLLSLAIRRGLSP